MPFLTKVVMKSSPPVMLELIKDGVSPIIPSDWMSFKFKVLLTNKKETFVALTLPLATKLIVSYDIFPKTELLP